ncbi:MAG: Fic family protein [Proteobacteria bacterium]|nr:Fic family protein [Pseudomonadota bacterium]
MKDEGRYNVSGLVEAQFEPGSGDKVLRNLQGITDPEVMSLAEVNALAEATDAILRKFDQEHRFTADDICLLHKIWLGKIYEWSGQYRQVNVSKGEFTFAMAVQVPKLMAQFEQEQLRKYTPCLFENTQEVVMAIAEVHTELVLIHPFREGNGRVSRLLATLMALQAGLPLLDFSAMNEKKGKYFAAVQAGMERNYKPMEMLFAEIIENTISASDE